MYKNVYLTELDAGGEDAPPELHAIRTSILEKLIAKGIPITTNVEEAHFIIVFFTLGFIRRRLDILFILPKLRIGHSVVLWDHKHYPPDWSLTFELLITNSGFEFHLTEELAGHYPDDCVTPESQFKIREALRFMSIRSIVNTTCLSDGRFLPKRITDTNYLINEQVEAVVDVVNPLSIDFSKIAGLESGLLKLALLINNNNDGNGNGNGGTHFVVISGCAQTHDITTITKTLTMEYVSAFPPYYNGMRYYDNHSEFCPQPPLTLADGLLADYLALDLTDFHNDLEKVGKNLKYIMVFDGISSLDELKEIRKLGDLCNLIGPGSLIILSTGLDIFRECRSYFESQSSPFLGYVEGAALTGQSAFMDIVADGWRPFCLKLNDSQLGDVIEMAECRDKGGRPKGLNVSLTMFPDESKFVGAMEGVGEGVKELTRGRDEEVDGDSKRLKLI